VSPEEPPTRRIPPRDPQSPQPSQTPGGPPPGGVRETEYVTEGGPGPEEELRDRVRSLQTALAVVGVLAAAALGVALWSLLGDDDEGGDGRGASTQRVSRLQDRVERLEDRVDERATKNDVSSVEEDLAELRGEVEQASRDDGDDDGAQEAVDDLRSDLQRLTQRVDRLAAQGGGGGGGDSGSETTTTP
jgi:hypothetical protein